MSLGRLQSRFGRIFTQRCFLLFAALLILIVAVPFFGGTIRGRWLLSAAQTLVLIAAVAAVGRTTMPFGIALLLGIPAFGFLLASDFHVEQETHYLLWAHVFFIAFYLAAVVYLLRYVFNPEVMTEDKLFGAAAGYLMLGILWAYAYNLLLFDEPASFRTPGSEPPGFYELLYMSFGCLTSTGPGELTPVTGKARALVMIEQVCGVLFVAILIARLAGIYTPQKPDDRA